jgi:hypothetical protein
LAGRFAYPWSADQTSNIGGASASPKPCDIASENEVGGGEVGGIDTYQNHGVTAAQIDHRVAVDHGRAGEALAGSVMDWGGIDYGWPLLQTSEDALESLRGLPDEPRLSSEEPE